ncbi:fasciclin-1 isoform X2 [Zeugodacus cucurbitae]|uniref:fasciclin-1 isoform X2 n=2 Tax=Zeugodacus cucurbitae TaxID=28588 RepID=UPI0023D8E59C|nr:fasciclin-1 isoform X2 [Zeugodacus cucurbitae]
MPSAFRRCALQAALLACLCVAMLPLRANASIVEKLRDDPDLSQFYSLLEQNIIANSTLTLRPCTVFVPTNAAFQRHNGSKHVLYHITTTPMTKDELIKVIPSDMGGNPSLYITKNRNGDTYVNNARIIPSLTVEMTNSLGMRQVMHIIDEVLVPLTALPTAKMEYTNLDAYQFMKQADILDIGDNRLRSYRSQVTLMRKDNLYQAPGGHTFLVPVDEGFKQTTRSSLVDNKVIDGHVIPNNVIFTAAAQMEVPQTTAAFEDNLKVTVSFFKQKDGKMYVKSNTIIGDAKHPTGVVLAEIVKGNIPVRNGVVHLIHRPLMIIDSTVTQFLQDNENGALRKFYDVIMDNGGEVLTDISNLGEITILAPSNDAWEADNVKNLIRNREKLREILNMHIIKDKLNVDRIRQKNKNIIAQVPTVNNRTFLYFNVKEENGEELITVEGGGVNATVLQADVAQTNGYVHIIDKVLGVPYTTVLEKLETDPMMSDTFKLGQFSAFNNQLNNTQRRFTYFVPRDKAWQKTKLDYPSTHKKLFMEDFSYHSRSILERHLVIADNVYTMNDMVAMTAASGDSILLPTYRDSLKVKVEEEAGRYVITWNFKKINVYRPDVECTNGIIHVIDYPMLEERDVVVNGGSYPLGTSMCILFSNILMIAIAKFLFLNN